MTKKKSFHKNLSSVRSFVILFICFFLFTFAITEILHLSISAATCMTLPQVQADNRCLYIANNQIYEMGSRSNPHHGHPCGTDVTAVLPASHVQTQSQYLLPNFITTICAVTPNPTPPLPTAIPTIPTPTLAPTFIPTILPSQSAGSVTFALTLLLDGIGNAGDKISPHTSGNMNPLHTQRTVQLSLMDSANTTIANQQGAVSYNSSSGNFTGIITVNNIPNTAYTITVSTSNFAQKSVAGLLQTASIGNYNVPSVSLLAGDSNNDGQINILDYNLLIGCFGSKQHAPSCTNAQGSDLNDDGLVNGFDYNLFLRETAP
jgi:Dockerin type I domain